MLKHNKEKYKTMEPVIQCKKESTQVSYQLKGVKISNFELHLVIMQGITH